MALCMLIGMLPAMSIPARAEAVDPHNGHAADRYMYWGIVGNVLHISKEKKTDITPTIATTANQPAWRQSPYCETITRVVVDDELRPNSVSWWFSGCSNITEMDLSNLDTCCANYMDKRLL